MANQAIDTHKPTSTDTTPELARDTAAGLVAGGLAQSALGTATLAEVGALNGASSLSSQKANPEAPWVQIYPNGTVESGRPDGSVTWISDQHGWHAASTLGPTRSDGSHKVATMLVDNEGNIIQRTGDDHVLDRIVDGQCVPEASAGANPLPCAVTNSDIAVLKARGEADEYLVIPTLDVTGVEDKQLLDSKTANYFAEALDPNVTGRVKNLAVANEEKDLVNKGMTEAQAKAKAELDVRSRIVAVTVNSAAGRSQDRLHIHDDFILPDVQDNLKAQLDAGKISDKSFQDVGVLENGHDYRGMWVDADKDGTLGNTNPFKLVYDSLPQDKKDTMDLQTVAVVPETKQDGTKGFIVLTGTADPATDGGTASAEELQHKWTVL